MDPKRLIIPSWVLIAFGLLTVASTIPALTPGLSFFADLAFFPLDGQQSADDPVIRFIAAVGGGIMTGWGVTLLVLARGGDLRQAVLWGAFAWFIPDSLGSIISGAPMNAVYNLGFLAIFLVAAWPKSAPAETAGERA